MARRLSQGRRRPLLRPPRRPSPDPRRAAHARRADRHRARRRRRRRLRRSAASAPCSATPRRPARCATGRATIEQVHAVGGAGDRRHRSAGVRAAAPARRARCRHRRRLVAAVRRADRVRRPARRRSSPCANRRRARCPAGWSASAPTPPAARPCGWRCRPASSTSAARRRPRTSARPRCCWPTSPGLYAAWHGPDGLRRIAGRVHGLRRAARRPRSRASGCARSPRRRVRHGRGRRTSTPTR